MFLSKEGIDRFFNTFFRVKELLFKIQRFEEMKKTHALSTVAPLWPLTIAGLLLSFISGIAIPLIGMLYSLDGYALVALSLFIVSTAISLIPLLEIAVRGKTLSSKLVVGYSRHIRHVLRLKWVLLFGSKPRTSSGRKLLVECRNPECRREFFSGFAVASTERSYHSRNIDRNAHQCPHCKKSAVYSWKDYRFGAS